MPNAGPFATLSLDGLVPRSLLPETAELESVFSLHNEMSWKTANRRVLPEMKTATIKAFAALATSIAEAS